MKRILTAFMVIGLMAAALTGCTAKKDEPTSTPPSTISEDVSVGNEVSETLDTREGEPMPTNIIPESYPEYPMDVTFFTGTADIFAKVPDISAAIRDTPAKMEFSSSKLESVYTPTDVNAAIAAVGDMLLQADFVKADNVNAQLDLDDPDSAPGPGDIVYLRAADGIFISLTDEGGNLVARYRQGSSYYAGGKPVAIEPSGNNGSNYKGVLFDRAPFDYVAERYGNYVPEPNNPLGTPAYISFIDSDHGVAGYVFKIDNPDARAESFKMTMEDAGFTTESFAVENSTYIKASIKVSLEIVKKTSVFSEATVTLETLPGSNAGDPAPR